MITNPRAVVITGGVGSGKSTATDLFGEFGVRVVDADAIAREVTLSGGEAIPALRAAFDEKFFQPDGGLDRDQLRTHVFRDADARSKLEFIVHPIVARMAREAIAQAPGPYVVYSVPLWFELYGHTLPDWVWRRVVVDCPEAVQKQRVRDRSGWSDEIIDSVMRRQARRDERLTIADHILDNSSGVLELRDRVAALHHLLCAEKGAQVSRQ
jgi:dephospho-CoA kinase